MKPSDRIRNIIMQTRDNSYRGERTALDHRMKNLEDTMNGLLAYLDEIHAQDQDSLREATGN